MIRVRRALVSVHDKSGLVELGRGLHECGVEILTPDFKNRIEQSAREIAAARPDIFNHNVETAPRLYRDVRPAAVYEGSLELLRLVKRHDATILTKSGLMLGLGETDDQVLETLGHLREAGVDLIGTKDLSATLKLLEDMQ